MASRSLDTTHEMRHNLRTASKLVNIIVNLCVPTVPFDLMTWNEKVV